MDRDSFPSNPVFPYFWRVSKQKPSLPADPENGPYILALETATGVSSVAAFEAGKLLGRLDFHTEKLHARLITVMVDQLLSDLSISRTDLAAVAVSSGPGSYTGLRVGVSTAKGICMALDKPLISVGSMETLAHSVTDVAGWLNALIVPMIDARRMEVYCAVFDPLGNELEPTRAQVISEDSFRGHLRSRRVIFLGDGAAKCAPLLRSDNALVLENRLSSAADMGVVAWAKFQSGEFEDLVTFEPYYLKNYVATKSKNKIL
jgi:tRNA threonylcarbamoyladenosine biosynthesis protein TsaB